MTRVARDPKQLREIRRLARSPFQRWTIRYGLPLFGVIAVVAAGGGFLVGWPLAYDLLAGLQSPSVVEGDVLMRLGAWALSLTGWLVAPAAVGAVAGAVLAGQLAQHRTLEREDIRELAEQVGLKAGEE